ncbi:MATE family efflux transporter [Algirhabdus cladophorae]|uniref:MATE family efflux transporter n=1 Tax=Algirhabdus cladophorae TaxID=3377108 RepID=UPI003B84B597
MTQATENTTPSTARIFQIAWPLALRAVIMFSAVLIDLYFVSSLGEEAVAAIGLSGAIAGLLMGIVFAFSNAAQVKLAQAVGTENPLAIKTALVNGFIINIVLAGIGIATLLILARPIVDFIAHSPKVAALAMTYMRIFFIMIAAEAVGLIFGSFFNGDGRTKIPFYSFLIAFPLNILATYVLVFGHFGMPELGVAGAAWGTALAAIVRLLVLAAVFWSSDRALIKLPGWIDADRWMSLREQVRFAWPIAATFISMNFAANTCTLIYANMNIHQFAAMTLIMPWVRIAGLISYSWAQATGILMAQLLGKTVSSEALDAFLLRARRAIVVLAVIVSLTYVGIVFATQRIYVDLDAQTRTALFSFLPVLLIIPFPRALNALCGNVLRAAGDTHYSMRVHVGAQWLILVPVTAVFVLLFDLPAVWVFAVYLLEEATKFIPFHQRIRSGSWHHVQHN